ncbi:MAG: CAP domain-containing protein [Oscillospiraceae bacterium]|jgi:uncharacterized protein YkwD|nr:CAP domain-containing protein [Oscillospiraceae bacterium]
MKKVHLPSLLLGLSAAALFFTVTAPAKAEGQPITVNGINIRANGADIAKEGEPLRLTNGAEVPFSIGYNGTNYLPIGKMAELFGISAVWDGPTRTAVLGEEPEEGFGAARREIDGWGIYHDGQYRSFAMVHNQNGVPDAVYAIPGTRPKAAPGEWQIVTEYKDENDGNRVYAALYANPGAKVPIPFSEEMVFELTNAFRALHGAAPLTWNDTLAATARAHSKDMHDANFVEHVNLRGEEPKDRALAAGYQYRLLGENIAAGYGDAVGVVHALINSEGHRLNMINTGFSEMGVGNFTGGNHYRHYSTQLYGSPR